MQIIIFTALFFWSYASAQSKNDFEQMIVSFQKTQYKKQEAMLEKIVLLLLKEDSSYAKKQIDKIVRLTSGYKEQAGIKVNLLALIWSAYFGSSEEKIIKLKKGFEIASANEFYDLMARAKANLSGVYKQTHNYDSSMICLLEAKQFFEKANDLDEVVSLIHTIGDFYYEADLLDKAESAYLEVLKLKGESRAWRDFRYVVIKNNLGLIEFKRKNYKKAIDYFNISLNYKLSYKGGELDRNDSTHLAYIYMKLALSNLMLKNYPATKEYLDKSMIFTQSVNYTENLIYLLIIRSNLFYEFSDYNSALKFLNNANDLNVTHGNSGTTLELSSAFAIVYEKLGDYQSSLKWFKSYKTLSDSIALNKKAAASLQLKAETENRRNLESISALQKEKFFVTGIALFLIISLSTILVILMRLRKSDKMLIDKNIELVQIENRYQYSIDNEKELESAYVNFDTDESELTEEEIEPDSNIQFVKIISKLEKLMLDKRLFTNPFLTLEELAHHVECSRNNLSKAINSVYKLNFSSYINMLRVKESIRLVTTVGGTPYSIEGLGREVGFNNRTSFILAFKKYSGVTPSHFLKNIGKEIS